MNKNKKFTLSKVEGLIPELRFPEFKDEGEWNIEHLADIGNIQQGFGFPISYQGNKNGEFPFIKVSDISNIVQKGKFEIDEAVNYISSNDIVDLKVKTIPIGTTVFAKIGEAIRLNRRAITCCESLIDNNVAGVKAIDGKTTDRFVYYILSKIDLLEYSGGTIPSVNKTTLENIPIIIPTSVKEQQKIASCLSSLDEVITAHSQKLELLKNHKKGLMQNLFPQEGEKVPKYRFTVFENDGEWVKKTLGEVYSFKITNSYSRENLNYENGEVKNIHYGDIHKQFRTMFDITREKVPFINQDLPINRIAQENYCKEGDMIFADASEDVADIGKAIEIVNLNNEKLVSGLHTLLARPNLKDLRIGFGAYLFQSLQIRKQIQKESQGTKVLSISGTRLSNISILLPSKREQQKIASCLSALDELITAQAEKIEQLKQHKKGLMQGLFPKSITNYELRNN